MEPEGTTSYCSASLGTTLYCWDTAGATSFCLDLVGVNLKEGDGLPEGGVGADGEACDELELEGGVVGELLRARRLLVLTPATHSVSRLLAR